MCVCARARARMGFYRAANRALMSSLEVEMESCVSVMGEDSSLLLDPGFSEDRMDVVQMEIAALEAALQVRGG